MNAYLNTHYALHMQREQALKSHTPGPRLMVSRLALFCTPRRKIISSVVQCWQQELPWCA